MTLDIRGGLKNTKLNQNQFVVFDELISNAIDSFLIRAADDANSGDFHVSISIEFFSMELDGESYDMKVTCADNGAGLQDSQMKAFVTKDTSYKDDLAIEGIGKCKGSGRIQFFHYFSKVSIESTFFDGGKYFTRKLTYDETMKEIDESSFKTKESDSTELNTEFVLDIIKGELHDSLFRNRNLRKEFSVHALKHHVLVTFLQRLVGLRERLGDFSITLQTKYKTELEDAALNSSDLPTVTNEKSVKVYYTDSNGRNLDKFHEFKISHYKLPAAKYDLPRNSVALCAKASPVKTITKQYLRTVTLENNPVDGFYHIVLVESDYLDEHVNEQRDDFDIPKDEQQEETFLERMLSFEKIFAEIDPVIIDLLEPPDWDKEQIVEKMYSKYGVSPSMITDVNVRIHYGDSEDTVVKRVLREYQERIIEDTSAIFELRQKVSEAEPDSEDFREKVNELAWKYTASLKSMDMANLSQLVVRRAAVIEILGMAVRRELKSQSIGGGEKRKDERIIHSIFFPMGKDSHEVDEHDIWLLSEEYHYYDYIASDKQLSKIAWDDGNLLFEEDIDSKLLEILQKNSAENEKKRPDIALFCKEGSAIIIEFKAPDVNLDDHLADLMEYAQLLAAKSKGKLKRFYGYLIGTTLNPNRMRGYKQFPNGKGWFGTEEIREHTSGERLGELYSEVLFYDDLLDKATKRIEVYRERLKIDFS
ncbi:MAG: hypothetical protein H6858_04060 [Rhodospirillales bacterium]|nr:hypothetical protein [Alphaproteobacteria bacterium]MCB9976761.1 hypothetical protein [Rhodospirillales bacterium]